MFKVLLAAGLLFVVCFVVYLRMRRERFAARGGAALSAPRPKADEAPAPGRPAAGASGWAPFFTPERRGLFLGHVESHFQRRGFPFRVEDGIVHTTEEGEPHHLGLGNLSQICHQTPEAEWPDVIDKHFASLDQSKRDQRDLESMVHDLDKVQDLLAVRIGPKETMPADLLVGREDLPGTLSYLVLDLPSSVMSLRPDVVASWGRPIDELFGIGLRNLRNRYAPKIETVNLDPAQNIECTVMMGDDFFVASHALMLDRHPETIGSRGALLAVPHRHTLMAYPIRDLGVIQAVHRIALIATGMYQEGPGSITPKLYWYHDGTYTDLPYEVDDATKTFQFRPPNEFIEMLNGLAEPERPKFA